MSKDYELYEPYRDWDPFIERDEGQKEREKAYGEIIVPLRLRSRSFR